MSDVKLIIELFHHFVTLGISSVTGYLVSFLSPLIHLGIPDVSQYLLLKREQLLIDTNKVIVRLISHWSSDEAFRQEISAIFPHS